VGGKITVVYGTTVLNRNIGGNLILIFPVFEASYCFINKKYNDIPTKPAPVPYCTQIGFFCKRFLNLMLHLPASASKYIVFSNTNFVSDYMNKQEELYLLRFGAMQ